MDQQEVQKLETQTKLQKKELKLRGIITQTDEARGSQTVQLLTNELALLKVQLEQLTTRVEAFASLDERLVRVETT